MKQKVRCPEMDILKGIGIILVVVLHVGLPSIVWTNYFNLFHMAIFFFASGWCFNGKNVSEQGGSIKYVIKKLKTLYVPYVLFNGCMILLNNFFIKINIYTDNIEFLEEKIGIGNAFGLHKIYSMNEMFYQIGGVIFWGKYGETQMGGATWFLRALFIVSILFFFVQKITQVLKSKFQVKLNAIVVQSIVATILLFIGWNASKNGVVNYYQIFTSASIYFIYVFGWIIKKVNVIGKLRECNGIVLLLLIVSGGLLFLVGNYETVAMNANSYKNPFLLICASVLGSILCTSCAVFLAKTPNFIGEGIECIGKNSMSIMMFHFLAFKIITFIQVYYYNKPEYLLAAYPVLDVSGFWRLLYILAGIFVPILLQNVYSRIIKRCFRKKNTTL